MSSYFAATSSLAPKSSTVLFWIPLLEIFHLVQYPNRQSAITGTGREELGTMHVIPFPELGYAISGTVVVRVPYRNWTICVWSISGTGLCQFRYGHCLIGSFYVDPSNFFYLFLV